MKNPFSPSSGSIRFRMPGPERGQPARDWANAAGQSNSISSRARPALAFLSLTLFCFAATPATDGAEMKRPQANWERSIVQIDVKRKNYDFLLPWTTPLHNAQKYG